ncbi:MAG: hypothetical protein AMS27_17635 [Bacteroides sp. SM23_62_1]|nr:MAG: hypothetical protein AMS27_17635 [Bacteroides sp. SM23_62_1]
MLSEEVIQLLNEKADQYNHPRFIEDDPVQVPHLFSTLENIEISGFLTATIAWGQRKMIIRSAMRLMELMDNNPFDFIMNASGRDVSIFECFMHRTFNYEDCKYFIRSIRHLYQNYGGLRGIFENIYHKTGSIKQSLMGFRKFFFESDHLRRTEKHIADVSRNASAKRLNMFLRWMVRRDNRGVDFGLWDRIDPSDLYIPLDIHTGTIARQLNLLKRKQNDWKAVEQLTTVLRQLDPADPVKYDFALFGMGMYEDCEY